MTKSLAKPTSYGEQKRFERKVKVLGRNHRVLSKQKEVKSTSGKTSLEIDNEIAPQLEISSEELNGISISDPVNNLFLIRQNGVWRKIVTEPL